MVVGPCGGDGFFFLADDSERKRFKPQLWELQTSKGTRIRWAFPLVEAS